MALPLMAAALRQLAKPPIRVLVCCDRFKGTAQASDVNRTIGETIRSRCDRHRVAVDWVSLTDGGAGFLDALESLRTPERKLESVVVNNIVGPLSTPLAEVRYCFDDQALHAYIEMAAAAGIELVPEHLRDPSRTTTFGVGQLIKHAVDRGARQVTVGLGGSATNDGGLGALQALGALCEFDDDCHDAYGCGGNLCGLKSINLNPVCNLLKDVTVHLMTDVSNVLTGPTGCAAVYGPQKGATDQMVSDLDVAMMHYGELLRKRAVTSMDPVMTPGAGAAGGLGAGLIAACPQVAVVRGAEVFGDMANLDSKIQDAAVVITGEGAFDDQTIRFGKTAAIVIDKARSLPGSRKVYVVCGVCRVDPDHQALVDGIFSLSETYGADAALRDTLSCLKRIAIEKLDLGEP